MRDNDLKDLSRFLRELQAETDRGLALVGAALIDDKIRATLAAFFVEGPAAARVSPDQVRWRSIGDEKPPEGSPVLGIFEAKK
jgi:hypothetical protein